MAFIFGRSLPTASAVLLRNSAALRPAAVAAPSMRWYGGAAAELTKEGATERVLEVVKKFHKVNPEKVTDKSHFMNELGLDSLDCVELVMAIEDEFALEVPESEQESLVSVDSVISYVLSNPNAK